MAKAGSGCEDTDVAVAANQKLSTTQKGNLFLTQPAMSQSQSRFGGR